MTDFRIWQIAGWTMLHYLWVGGVLGVVAVTMRRLLRGRAANLRYLAALGCFALLSVAPLPIAVVVTSSLPPPPRSEPRVEAEHGLDRMPMALSLPGPEGPAEAAVAAPAIPPSPAPAAAPRMGELLQSVLDRAAMDLPWLWVVGAPITFLLTTLGLVGAERLRRQSRLLEDSPIVETCRRLATALRISRRVAVGICDRIAAPILVGVFRPLILLPAAALTGWDARQLEMVLLHELAHVRRYDNLVNLMQRIVESVLFFHPLVWVVSGWVRREREHCCDELVVARTGQPRAYAEILVYMADQVPAGDPAASFALARTVSSMAQRSLVARIRRILKQEEQTMQVSRKAVGLMFLGLVVLVIIGGYCSLASHAEVSPTEAAESQGQSDAKPSSARDADSRAWYVLSQVDTNGLLLGLPQRLGKSIIASRQQGPMWSGVENGGRLTLDVQVEGDVKGEIFIGFFADPRWWLAEPVQIRRVPGAGRYTFERLIPGKYQLGAMLGTLPKPIALGVHAAWPVPVEIAAGRVAEARMLMSTKFQNRPAGMPGLEEGFAGQWEKSAKLDASRLITVRTVDSARKPVPFCRVTFVDRGDGTETVSFHDAGTDEQGRAYCDKIDRAFSLCVQRFDFLPGQLASRYESRTMAKIYHAQDRPEITIQWDQFPRGTGRVVGKVHDQQRRPLKQYYLTLTRGIGEQHDWSDATSYAISLPVIDPEGRYEVADLPPGTYTVMVRDFDYSAYVWTFDGPKITIPAEPHAVVPFNVEVEAKELFYGRAVYEDGTPVSRGSWRTMFKKDITERFGGEGFSMFIEKDGTFRVPLSRQEHQQLLANSNGMVEVSADAPYATIRVPISDLSKDPARPFKVVVRKREAFRDARDSTSSIKSDTPATAPSKNPFGEVLPEFKEEKAFWRQGEIARKLIATGDETVLPEIAAKPDTPATAPSKKTVAELLREFNDEKISWKQNEVCRGLIAIGDKRVVIEMIPMLASENRHIRCNAGWVLAGLGDERGLPAVLAELKDTSDRPVGPERIRNDGTRYVAGQITEDHYYAAWVLEKIGDRRAVPALIEALHDEAIDYEAALVLGHLGDQRAVPALLAALERAKGDRQRRGQLDMRLWAGYALMALRHPTGSKTLVDFLNGQHDNELRPPDAASAQTKQLADQLAAWQRQFAAEAFVQFPDKAAVPFLIRATADKDLGIRVNAIAALGKTRDGAALPTLRALLADSGEEKGTVRLRYDPPFFQKMTVHEAAAQAIEEIAKAAATDAKESPGAGKEGEAAAKKSSPKPSAAKPADEVPPAKERSAPKEGLKTDLKPTPASQFQPDRQGVLRDASGRAVGIWGVDVDEPSESDQ